MSAEEQRVREQQRAQDAPQAIPEPEVEDKHKEQAEEMADTYQDDRPHTILPGTDGMIAGTAVADWVADEDRGRRDNQPPEGYERVRDQERGE
ncbi:hypothetical protein [Nocardia goodfellowii]|uniref:Uncharacterized protein n=1 Tax=Nocardia goodfellowii TaxID=882446 RepID=A0ABS4QGV1_9NOCA|nr:hypothetical protein [Nocardia goodfellowii]MBP2190328.1 hypothetical protein [Nocardia goodfellowii]